MHSVSRSVGTWRWRDNDGGVAADVRDGHAAAERAAAEGGTDSRGQGLVADRIEVLFDRRWPDLQLAECAHFVAIRGELGALRRKEGGGEATRAADEMADKAPLDSCEVRDVAKAGILSSGTSARAWDSQLRASPPGRRQVEQEPQPLHTCNTCRKAFWRNQPKSTGE